MVLERSDAARTAARRLEEAVRCLIAEDFDGCDRAVARIDLTALLADRDVAFEAVGRSRKSAPKTPLPAAITNAARRSVDGSLKRATFERDSYTCRYCGVLTVDPDVLKVMSRATDSVPFHANWRDKRKHILQWSISASLEHRIPVKLGGTNDASNLLTTCYQCNDSKKSLSLGETLDWDVLAAAGTDWSGLSGYLPRLLALFPPPPVRSGVVPRFGASTPDRRVRKLESSSTSDAASVPAEVVGLGSVVHAVAEDNSRPRNYRVAKVDQGIVVGQEFWFRDADGQCVYSREAQTGQPRLRVLARIVRTLPGHAPTEGLTREEQPSGTALT